MEKLANILYVILIFFIYNKKKGKYKKRSSVRPRNIGLHVWIKESLGLLI